jgi:hypothetical protein
MVQIEAHDLPSQTASPSDIRILSCIAPATPNKGTTGVLSRPAGCLAPIIDAAFNVSCEWLTTSSL